MVELVTVGTNGTQIPQDKLYIKPPAPFTKRQWSEVDLPELPDRPVKLSVAIMLAPWVPERVENVKKLLEQIPDATVIIAEYGKGIWHTAQRAWLALDPEATHHLVLQDDIELCQDFYEGAIKALTAQPNSLVSLYFVKASAVNGHWGFLPNAPTGLALCMPVPYIEPYLKWCRENISPDFPHDDYRFYFFAQNINKPVRFTYPALVNDLWFLSAHGQPRPDKRTSAFLEGSALDIDWNAGVDMPVPKGPSILRGLGETTKRVSVVMPFYKRIEFFRKALASNAQWLTRYNIEVVLVLDEPTQQQEVLALLAEYPKIKWRMLVNENDHEWRNPAKAINVGIRHAKGDYIMVCSPESVFVNDAPYAFLDDVRDNSFSVGMVKFLSDTQRLDTGSPLIWYGSIFAKKSHFEAVNGYDENLIGWGNDDNSLRDKFKNQLNLNMRVCYYIVLAHFESEAEREQRANGKSGKGGKDWDAPIVEYGRDFDKVILDTGFA